ncbi:MAG: GxxExxY protein [Caldilineaceae bacterium]
MSANVAKTEQVERILKEIERLSFVQKLELLSKLSSEIGTGIAQYQAHLERNKSAQSKYLHLSTDKLTYEIIGCAMALHREKGSAHRENIYQRGLEVYFENAQLPFLPQKMIEIFDDTHVGKLIGYYIPDFIVDNRVVVEIKALNNVDDSHIAQVIGYLAVTGCQVGLLLNFGERSLTTKRVLPPKDVSTHRVNQQWLFVPEWLRGEVESVNNSSQ